MRRRWLGVGLVVWALAGCGEPPVEVEVVTVPPGAESIGWVRERATRELAALATSGLVYEFSFHDARPESGITFRHHVVPDVAREYRAVHYDHGNAVSAADVDGDGRVDLYFANQLGANQLWRNLGGGRFEDVTERAGVAVADRVSVAGAFADVDNDGDPDLYVTSVREGNLFFENDGTGVFTDQTERSGLGYRGHSSAATFFDYDRDGLLDCFVSNVGIYTFDQRRPDGSWVGFPDAFDGHMKPERTERSVLYRNLGDGRFRDVSEETGLVDLRWTGDAVAGDFDDDGWIDLYVLNMQGLDGYWGNRQGHFELGTSFPRSSWGSMGAQRFDFDNDGRLDLFVTDMHSDMPRPVGPEDEERKSEFKRRPRYLRDRGRGIYGNSFFRNLGEGRYLEMSDEVGLENYWPWGPSAGDLNADGWQDVFIASSMSFPFRYGTNAIRLNDRGERFLGAEGALGVEPRPDGRVLVDWFDEDCGENPTAQSCQVTRATGRIRVRGTLGTRSALIHDLDGDGDLDIVALDFGSEPMILLSDLAQTRPVHFLEVELQGGPSNRNGFGARVTVKTAEGEQVQVQDGESGYLAQSVLPLYFGLGDAEEVQEVRIRWPSGTQQVVPGPIAAGGRLRVVETSAPEETTTP